MINIILASTIYMVDIKGEVNKPGVYNVDNHTISDVIKKAGGVTKGANTRNINLSKKVTDEMVIYIPNKNEKPCECKEKEIPLCPAANEEVKEPTTTKEITTKETTTKEITTEKKIININKDPLEDLLLLNGVGEVIAKRIIEYRNEKLFETIEEILNIKGIGETLFVKIKDYITI